MNKTLELEVELTSREESVEIKVEVEYHWDNDGIGAYEYWGSREVDRGTNYVDIDDVTYDKTGFTPEEIIEIETAIEKVQEKWCQEIAESSDDDGEPDYDTED